MKVDMKDFRPYNDILNEVDVPKLEDENKIILARCIKVPLLDIFLYDIKDPLFIEKFEFLKKMTKTLEFIDENTNKLLQEIVTISSIIKYIEDLKSFPYKLTKDDIIKQYNKEKQEYRESKETLIPKIKK